jgi:hypothetical protein
MRATDFCSLRRVATPDERPFGSGAAHNEAPAEEGKSQKPLVISVPQLKALYRIYA